MINFKFLCYFNIFVFVLIAGTNNTIGQDGGRRPLEMGTNKKSINKPIGFDILNKDDTRERIKKYFGDSISVKPRSKKVDITAGQDLRDPGEIYAKEWQKDKEVKESYASPQYLGDFKTKSNYVKIICRDHEFVDGDKVMVYHNDQIVQYEITLNYDYTGFDIILEEGFNKIDFEALNQGSSGPNTAEFKVYDDTGKLISANQWNLTTGVKATLIVVKE
ncbi:hypothetical protein [Ascidiimonas sp. W6]|uniref:hypothetical protein n=1 Tax=Ascidiimonas meishanensis TaxID=3128903 RepID=UPI0030ECA21D